MLFVSICHAMQQEEHLQQGRLGGGGVAAALQPRERRQLRLLRDGAAAKGAAGQGQVPRQGGGIRRALPEAVPLLGSEGFREGLGLAHNAPVSWRTNIQTVPADRGMLCRTNEREANAVCMGAIAQCCGLQERTCTCAAGRKPELACRPYCGASSGGAAAAAAAAPAAAARRCASSPVPAHVG